MSETTDFLTKFFDDKIAEDLGILPEQVTTEFIHEMRERMYKDPQFQFDCSSDPELLLDPEIHPLTLAKGEQWRQKCRKWAQEVLQQGPTGD